MGRVSDARERLIDAANELTAKLGYSAVTVDAICEHAGVKKGSFYHYFDSKAALSKAAIEEWWQTNSRPTLDTAFSVTNPPLERIRLYFDALYQKMLDRQNRGEKVMGCLLFSVAMEGGGVDQEVVEATQRVLARKRRYFDAAIREAEQAGLVHVTDVDAAVQARVLRCSKVLRPGPGSRTVPNPCGWDSTNRCCDCCLAPRVARRAQTRIRDLQGFFLNIS